MKQTIARYTLTADDEQSATRHCGLDIEPGPTVNAWIGVRGDGVHLRLPPEVACEKAIELIGAALDGGLSHDTFRAVRRVLDELGAVAGISKNKSDERQIERSAQAH